MIFQENFLGEVNSKPKNFFQENFFQKNFSTPFSFPERFFKNFLAFQDTLNKLMVGYDMYEKAKEDARKEHSDYPSA